MTLYLLQRKDMPGIYHRRISASTREPITTCYLEEAYFSRSLEEMIGCAQEYSNYEVCSVEVSPLSRWPCRTRILSSNSTYNTVEGGRSLHVATRTSPGLMYHSTAFIC